MSYILHLIFDPMLLAVVYCETLWIYIFPVTTSYNFKLSSPVAWKEQFKYLFQLFFFYFFRFSTFLFRLFSFFEKIFFPTFFLELLLLWTFKPCLFIYCYRIWCLNSKNCVFNCWCDLSFDFWMGFVNLCSIFQFYLQSSWNLVIFSFPFDRPTFRTSNCAGGRKKTWFKEDEAISWDCQCCISLKYSKQFWQPQ